MWLWNVKPDISFDVGYRIDEFETFENDEQFELVAEKLASHALEEVRRYRRLFQTIRHVSDYYRKNIPKSFWPSFNASIAHCLAGRTEIGRRLLASCTESAENDPKWTKEARSDAQSLLAIVGDEAQFRDVLVDRVQGARRLHKLSPVEISFSSRVPE
jgi:hypothetical protein